MSWGNPQSFREKLTSKLLSPAAAAYRLGSYVRMAGYASGVISRKQVHVPVVSVGNITCGGTGKTPIVIDFAEQMISTGRRVAILSRGYKRENEAELTVVSDGTGDYAPIKSSGDEPSLIARRVPEAIVIACANRRMSAEMAVTNFGCDVILLDDGFQHLKLNRDEDVVLIDYNDEPENDSLLPSGRLREPLSALGRASMIVISKIPATFSPDRIDHLTRVLRKYNDKATLYLAGSKPAALHDWRTGTSMVPGDVSGKKVVAFCGLARPNPFVDSLRELGANVVQSKAFPDHHWYSDEDISALDEVAKSRGAEYLVTTEKDLVKLEQVTNKTALLALRIDTNWIGRVPTLLEHANFDGHTV